MNKITKKVAKTLVVAGLAFCMLGASFGQTEGLYQEMFQKDTRIQTLESEVGLYEKEILRVDEEAKIFKGDDKIAKGLIEIDQKKILDPIRMRNEKTKRENLIIKRKQELTEELRQYLAQREKFLRNQTSLNGQYSLAKKELENAEKQKTLGQMTDTGLGSFKENVVSLEAKKSQVENDLKTNLYQINLLLGRDLLKEADSEPLKLNDISIEKSVLAIYEESLKDDITILNLELDKAYLEREIEILKKHYFKDNAENIQTKERELLATEGDLKDRKNALKLEVFKAYNNISVLEKELAINKLQYENRKADQKVAEARYKIGMVTDVENLKAKQAMQEAEIAVINGEMDLFFAKNSFVQKFVK